MNSMRVKIEDAIECLICLLDDCDGDPDFEPDHHEEQHDGEDDPAESGIADGASLDFVMAEKARRRLFA